MLKQGRGKVINIASLLSFQGGILVPAYAASKGAVAQLTRVMAICITNGSHQLPERFAFPAPRE